MISKKALAPVLKAFPPVDFAMAYGSAVFRQMGAKKDASRNVDLVFAVDDPLQWHRENLSRHPEHYSAASVLLLDSYPKLARRVQRAGAHVWYHPNMRVDGFEPLVKYGVISTEDLMQDLALWRTLYVSGRMHKPIHILKHHEEIERLQQRNLRAAFMVAQLMIEDESFTLDQLLWQIVRLSYGGDVRMYFGEDPMKIQNIVASQGPLLEQIYRPFIEEYLSATPRDPNTLSQSMSTAALYERFSYIPRTLISNLVEEARFFVTPEENDFFAAPYESEQQLDEPFPEYVSGGRGISELGRSEVTGPLHKRFADQYKGRMSEHMSAACAQVVRKSSRDQTLKGLITAKPKDALSYGARKVSKFVGNKPWKYVRWTA